ncbi:PAS domain-containing sensor histidine kinase [Aquisediminimonas sediminicola]|uniref:PAS domain-containing sensor histidine kinase n=1 Tax=Alteraquisediminimonas sediminicola TaxID=2676787 RepID=UPI002484B4D4|nr:PAS domain S-box protein [Aquisediminimonas sediminicola]
MPAAIAMLDRQMRYLAVSKRWLADYRIENEPVIGRCHYDVFPDLDGHWRDIHQRVLQGEPFSSDEKAVQLPNGKVEWLRWELTPWYEASGEIGGIIIFTERVTRQVEADQTVASLQTEIDTRQHFLSKAIESLTDGFAIVNLKGELVQCNSAYTKLHRFDSKQDFVEAARKGYEIFEVTLLDNTHVPRIFWPLSRGLRGESAVGAEYYIRRKDTGERWIGRFNFTPIEDKDGRIHGAVLTGRDITMEKAIQAELSLNAEHAANVAEELNLLVDGVREYAIYMLDSGGRVSMWNDGAARLTGWAHHEVLGADRSNFHIRPSQDGAAPDDKGQEDDLARARAQGGLSHDTLHRRKDGTDFIAHESITPLFWADGSLRGYSIVVHDVSEQREVERKLRAGSALLESILATVPDAIVVIDGTGQILSFSSAAQRLFGYTEEEALGRNVSFLMPSPDRELHDDYLTRLHGNGARHIIGVGRTMRGRKRDGQVFPIELYIGEADGEGQPIYTGFIRDLTEHQRDTARMEELRAELIHVARVSAMGTMASTLAHELNQPITAVKNYVEGLKNLIVDPNEDIADALEHAAAEAMRAGKIVRHLRDFVSHGTLEKTLEDPRSIIREALEFGAIGTRELGVEITLNLDPQAKLVLVDRVQIQQVLINMMRNATEALANTATKRITISTRPDGDQFIRFSVMDTGNGIPDAIGARLFRAFTSSKSEGMGLGLSICRTIVEAHGGRIWYEPDQDGGSIFHFTLQRGELGETDGE